MSHSCFNFVYFRMAFAYKTLKQVLAYPRGHIFKEKCDQPLSSLLCPSQKAIGKSEELTDRIRERIRTAVEGKFY